MISHELLRTPATATILQNFQIVIPKEVRGKLRRSPRPRLQIIEKGEIIEVGSK
jgi:AbrB family looped-hinge helix DNA binding protein